MKTVSAGQWELRRRLILLIALVVLIAVIVLGASRLIDGQPLAVVTGILVAVTAVVLWRVGRSQSASVAAEKQAGYSTLYDFEGYELRDYRTGAVIRPSYELPSSGIRRSLVSGMLTVTAGSPLARRLADEAGRTEPGGRP